jgi:PAS domain S-box-containing protein
VENQFVRYFSGLGIGYANEPLNKISLKQTVQNCFFNFDKNWTITYCNKAAERLLGVAPSGALGKNLWTEFKYSVPQEFYDFFHRTILKENAAHFEEYLGAMGGWLDVIVYHCDSDVSVSFKSLDHPSNVDGLQLQLGRLNELYRFVTEITSDCLWEWDLETKEIFWIDGGHKRVFGYQIENAVIPQSFWEDRIHPDDKIRVLESLRNLNAPDKTMLWEQEYRFRNADGKYVHVHDRGKIIYDKKSGSLRMTGTTQDISVRKSLELQLASEISEKTAVISKYNVEAQEKERIEIADELYNNLNQTLCAAKMHIEIARTDEEKRNDCLANSSENVLNVINEIQTIYRKLRIPGMYRGLFYSIQLLLERQDKICPIAIDFKINNIDEEDLDDMLRLDLYWMVQELIDNITKHASATHAQIDMSRVKNEIILLVSNNGQECDLLKFSMGMGFIQMINCADLYEGRVDMISIPENGYQVKVTLPLGGRRKNFRQLLNDYDD